MTEGRNMDDELGAESRGKNPSIFSSPRKSN